MAFAALGLAWPALAAGVAVAATAGDLDPSFDGDGKSVLPFAGSPAAVLLQPDGKIVLAGEISDADFAVWRLNADGTPDRGFGGDGEAVADFGGRDSPQSAALQPDGKIVVAGYADAGAGIARFNANGSLDATFDPGGADGDGKKILETDDALSANAVIVQRDGKIVLAGSHWAANTPADFTITRLKPGGAVDDTVFEPADFGGEDWATAAAPGPGGTIVVVGTSKPSGAPDRVMAVARYNDDGSLDKTFAQTGKTTLGPGDPTEVLVQPDGKVLVVSRSETGDPLVTRLTSDGKPDAIFGDHGTAAGGFDGEKLALAVAAALRPDGKLYVAGTAADATAFAVGRLSPGGALDTGFGSGGSTAIDFGSSSVAGAAALQPDGKLVVAGATLQGVAAKLAVVRLLGDPSPAVDGSRGDTAPPRLTRLRVVPARFARRKRAQIRFTLSEPAAVTLRFQRVSTGRQVGGACRALTARTRDRRPCRRYLAAGTLRHAGHTGPNRVAFSRRIGRRALRRGTYRLLVTAIDPAGNRSTSQRRGFRIVGTGSAAGRTSSR
jgi:uncharacterized delta-60 repeat protein